LFDKLDAKKKLYQDIDDVDMEYSLYYNTLYNEYRAHDCIDAFITKEIKFTVTLVFT